MSKFTCSERKTLAHSDVEGQDFWREMPNGDRTCSFCGSLHEDDFFDILEKYVEGIPGYRFSTTTKEYKRYANRPGVTNAAEGGIKFYSWHADTEHNYQAKNAIYQRAIEKFKEELKG